MMGLLFPKIDLRLDIMCHVSEEKDGYIEVTPVPVANVVKFGADPTGQRSSVDAINDAMDALRTLHYMSRDDA